MTLPLKDKTVLVTGAGKRVGKELALGAAQAGADVIVHYGESAQGAEETALEIRKEGRNAWTVQADLSKPELAAGLVESAWKLHPFDYLVNNAAIFEPLSWDTTTLETWQTHMNINLASPFFLSQAFARTLPETKEGRIINILDWRALRPGADHLPYSISKAGLAALTHSLAAALAPRITVNGIALGAILPPADGADASGVLKLVPARRWAKTSEIKDILVFLLSGPAYITGEIIHLDGGRHIL